MWLQINYVSEIVNAEQVFTMRIDGKLQSVNRIIPTEVFEVYNWKVVKQKPSGKNKFVDFIRIDDRRKVISEMFKCANKKNLPLIDFPNWQEIKDYIFFNFKKPSRSQLITSVLNTIGA